MQSKEEFRKIWIEKGPFITQAIAAKILGTSRSNITQQVEKNNIKSVELFGTRFPILSSVFEYEPNENKKNKKTNE